MFGLQRSKNHQLAGNEPGPYKNIVALVAIGTATFVGSAQNQEPQEERFVLTAAAGNTVPAADMLSALSFECVAPQECRTSLNEIRCKLKYISIGRVGELIDSILTRDSSGKDMIDELFHCIDMDHDGKIRRDEIGQAVNTIDGLSLNLNNPFPDEPRFSQNNPFTPKAQEFLRRNWNDFKQLHLLVRLFIAP